MWWLGMSVWGLVEGRDCFSWPQHRLNMNVKIYFMCTEAGLGPAYGEHNLKCTTVCT